LNLRHITLKKNLQSIYNDGALEASKTLRNGMDKEYVAFELNPNTDVLLDIFHKLKSNDLSNVHISPDDVFELIFDGNKMLADGIEIVEKVGGNSKVEISIALPQWGITEKDWMSIGEYRFVKGKASLQYLTEESSKKLHAYLHNIQK
jgi:hypothetical protein